MVIAALAELSHNAIHACVLLASRFSVQPLYGQMDVLLSSRTLHPSPSHYELATSWNVSDVAVPVRQLWFACMKLWHARTCFSPGVRVTDTPCQVNATSTCPRDMANNVACSIYVAVWTSSDVAMANIMVGNHDISGPPFVRLSTSHSISTFLCVPRGSG